jgi:hypothetical protein
MNPANQGLAAHISHHIEQMWLLVAESGWRW